MTLLRYSDSTGISMKSLFVRAYPCGRPAWGRVQGHIPTTNTPRNPKEPYLFNSALNGDY